MAIDSSGGGNNDPLSDMLDEATTTSSTMTALTSKRKRNNGTTIIAAPPQYPDPQLSYIPPDIWQLLDHTSKEAEEAIEYIPDDLGAKNVKLIIKLALTFARHTIVSSYIQLLCSLQHARMLDQTSLALMRQSQIEQNNINTLVQKLNEIPTRSDLATILAQHAAATAATTVPTYDEAVIETAKTIHESSKQIVQNVLNEASASLSKIATSNIRNLQEDPLKRRMGEMLANLVDATTSRLLPTPNKAVSAKDAFDIK